MDGGGPGRAGRSQPVGRFHENDVRKLRRRRRGVEKQLLDMGLPIPAPENAGKAWTQEEEARLITLYRLRRPVEKMARELRRSVRAVCLRMERLELYGDEPGYPRRP